QAHRRRAAPEVELEQVELVGRQDVGGLGSVHELSVLSFVTEAGSAVAGAAAGGSAVAGGGGRLLSRSRTITQARLPSTRAATAATATTVTDAPSSLRPEASSRIASARRMSPPGARLETWAPNHAPGIAPTSRDTVSPSSNSP